MPGYQGHMLGAFCAMAVSVMTLSAAGYYVSGTLFMQGLFFALLGALFPDIDTKSKGQKLLYAIIFVFVSLLLIRKNYGIAVVVALVAFLPLFVRHRGLFHSLWFAVAITAACVGSYVLAFPSQSLFALQNGGFFLVGFLSHILLDFGIFGLLRRR